MPQIAEVDVEMDGSSDESGCERGKSLEDDQPHTLVGTGPLLESTKSSSPNLEGFATPLFHLPYGIKRSVVSHSSFEDAKALSLVSREWMIAADTVIFQRLVLNPEISLFYADGQKYFTKARQQNVEALDRAF